MKQPFLSDEQKVSNALMEAYEAWQKLQNRSKEDKKEWIYAFHKLQDLLGHRVLKRDYPETFK